MKVILTVCLIFALAAFASSLGTIEKKMHPNQQLPLHPNEVKLPPRQRAEVLLKQMNFTEKLAMVHGYGGPYVGNVIANSRLRIPKLNLEDGPQGVADGVNLVTCWPSALTVVASWDREMMHQFGQAMGQEQRMKGTNIMLGPMVNLLRVPVDGRSFESMGEDPFLAGEMAANEIRGVQSNGIMACVKHLVDNNQEYNRTSTSANIDERTQYELYLRPFYAAIKAGVASIMCSYNRVNNVYACENNDTLNTAVKQHFGYQGFIMSDWGATHSTVDSANYGLDMQMPDDYYFGQRLQQAILDGKVPRARLDDMVLRILTSMYQVGIFDEPNTGNLSVNVQSPEHVRLARELGQAATVLLSNQNNILPINLNNIKSIAVSGDDASSNPTFAGYGSGHVNAPYVVTPLQGIQNIFKGSVSYAQTKDVTQAVNNAKNAQVAIVFVAVDSSEGSDRPNLSLGTEQNSLVSAVAAAQPNTIVVIHAPGPVLMPWANSVKSIIHALLPGQEDGNVIADVLFGLVNPSGKLPFSNPATASEIAVNTTTQYPGINNEAAYSEGLYIGYRWYDQYNFAPLFEFGAGLSYTTFSYSNLAISGNMQNSGGVTVTFDVKNTGNVDGAEVSQLYLEFPQSANTPPKQLRGFSKEYLFAGQTRTVTIELDEESVNVWDPTNHQWKVITGQFGVLVGSSSKNILLKGTFTV